MTKAVAETYLVPCRCVTCGAIGSQFLARIEVTGMAQWICCWCGAATFDVPVLLADTPAPALRSPLAAKSEP